MTQFRVKLVDFGSDLSYAGGDDTEHELSFTPTLESWMTLDIPLTDFVNLASNYHIAQLIFSGNPTGNGVVYVDNVLFHNVVTGIETIQANEMKLYPNPVQNELSIGNSENLASIHIYSLTGENILVQMDMTTSKIDVSHLDGGIYICEMQTIHGEILQAKFIKE
jgi:CRISPR/Cas system endoribonuclease Cas6 (RAMP superfamily)